MATNYPTSIDAYTNPASTDVTTSPDHAGQHANVNDAVLALETKVGVTNSAVTTSLDYRVNLLEQVGPTGKLVSGGVGETFPRYLAATNTTALTSQTLYVQAITLTKSQVVTNITYVSGTTAAGTPTNWWFVLLDSSLVVKAVTADQLTTAWAADTIKTVAVGTPYTIPTSGLYYVGIMMKATTPISTVGIGALGKTTVAGISPIIAATSSTGQTTPPALAATMGALTVSAIYPWASIT